MIVVDACKLWKAIEAKYDSWEQIYNEIADMIVQSPSTQKTGRWMEDDKGYFYCTNCELYPNDQTRKTDYCPNCGARMITE